MLARVKHLFAKKKRQELVGTEIFAKSKGKFVQVYWWKVLIPTVRCSSPEMGTWPVLAWL
jgi:hypothetical protein